MWPIIHSNSSLVQEYRAICFFQEAQCGYLMIIMGIFWCTEVLPLSITALLPVVALPLFEIMTTGDVCAEYMAVGSSGLKVYIIIVCTSNLSLFS